MPLAKIEIPGKKLNKRNKQFTANRCCISPAEIKKIIKIK